MKETFKDIKNYEGHYQVSSLGRVRSLDRYVRCKGDKERLIKGRILRLFKSKRDGDCVNVVLCRRGVLKTYKVHRLVLIAFDRSPKANEECNHKNGIRYNNFIINLEWCTHKQNCSHRDNVLGKHSRGEKSGTSKLVEDKVKEIRNLLKGGQLTQRQIGERFNISQSVISSINTNKSWNT